MTVGRITWAIGLLAGLASCGNGQGGDTLNSQLIAELRRPAQIGPTDINVVKSALTPEFRAQFEGPVLIAQVETEVGFSILTPGGTNTGVDTFVRTDGVSISLRDGVIIGTRGLGFDLMTADVEEPLAALRQRGGKAVRIHRYLDGANQLTTRSFLCTYGTAPTGLVSETCQSTDMTFTNSYSIGPSGQILAAQQWISPQIGMITTELVK